MSRIYWDTMLFVYLLEGHPEKGRRVQEIHAAMRVRGDALCTSVFTVGELLVGPYKQGAAGLASRIGAVLQPPTVEILPFAREAADRYAKIRAQHRIAPADAIHLASAAQAGVDLFLTHDRRLASFHIPGIGFITGLDTKLL